MPKVRRWRAATRRLTLPRPGHQLSSAKELEAHPSLDGSRGWASPQKAAPPHYPFFLNQASEDGRSPEGLLQPRWEVPAPAPPRSRGQPSLPLPPASQTSLALPRCWPQVPYSTPPLPPAQAGQHIKNQSFGFLFSVRDLR